MFRTFGRRSDASRRRVPPAGRRQRRWHFERLEERALLTLAGNTLFPADNPWNQSIAAAPVAANSSTLVASVGASGHVHPDFGTIYQGAYIGIPFNVVAAGQQVYNVVIDAYPDESDIVPVPIPAGAVIEGDPLPSAQNNGDRHLIVYDQDNNIAYELFNVRRPAEMADGMWHADSEAVWYMDQNWFRTPGDTSADAAGLPILPGLVRPDEVLDQGVIDHALRFTVPRSRNQYVYPASHHAGSNNASYPRMGERFRLKASFDISGFSPANQVILQALKTYGMIVADNGSGWYISGEPSSRWNDDELSQLKSIAGSNFEVVDLRPIVATADQTSGSTSGGTAVTIHGQNFSGAAGMLNVFFGATPATSVTIVSDALLVATSPAHAAGTVNITVQTPYGTSAAAAGAQFTFTNSASVVGRHIFYNQSAFDGNNSAIGSADDGAIAPDKTAYLAGSGLAGFTAVSSYSRGINGIMIDLAGPGSHASIDAVDFTFKLGNSNETGDWQDAPPPSAVSVRTGAGVSGSDRVAVTWADGAVKNTWLEVTVLATLRTGLASPETFYWASKVGDTGSPTATSFTTTISSDGALVVTGLGAASGIADVRDIDRSNSISAAGDRGAITANVGAIVRLDLVDPSALVTPRESNALAELGLAAALERWQAAHAPAEPATAIDTVLSVAIPSFDADVGLATFAAGSSEAQWSDGVISAAADEPWSEAVDWLCEPEDLWEALAAAGGGSRH